jgi:hypothetical protein
MFIRVWSSSVRTAFILLSTSIHEPTRVASTCGNSTRLLGPKEASQPCGRQRELHYEQEDGGVWRLFYGVYFILACEMTTTKGEEWNLHEKNGDPQILRGE